MSERASQQNPSSGTTRPSELVDHAGGKAVLAEATRHKDVLYTSLFGVACIVVILLVSLGLLVFVEKPLLPLKLFVFVVVTVLCGVAALSVINIRAHQNVNIQALLTEVLLNSLGQGFLSFDAKCICGQVYSEACLDLLEGAPAGKDVADVLRLTEEQKNDFRDWLNILFEPDHPLSFDDVVKFLPQTFPHSHAGRHITLLYRPVRDGKGTMLSLVMIATDQTEEAEAQLRAKAQQSFVSMVTRVFKERNQFMVTITHLRSFVEETKKPIGRSEASTILRLLHTLKASAKHFHLDAMGTIIHRLEADFRSADITSDQVFQEHLRKGGEEVDGCLAEILKQIGELIGQDFEGHGNLREISEDAIYEFAHLLHEQKVDPEIIRSYLSAIAAVPINEGLRQFEREIKDLAEIMGKRVKPVLFTGSNPRVLLQPMEGLFLSLIHMSRNIVDHGIEPVVTRMARSKEPAGQVSIHSDVTHHSETGRKMLQIVISDDGNGIDPALVRAKLSKIDPEGEWRFENDADVIQRIFQWEVSTRNEVTDISGRGVGMEAVEREIKMLGGSIKVYSELYRGTRFDIRVPYGLDVPAIAAKS